MLKSKVVEEKAHKFYLVESGFTLVELLVVIAIIAVLLSILMPTLKAARAQAQKLVCTSNMKNIGLATVLYLQDNKDFFPAPSGGYGFSWYMLLGKYVAVDNQDVGHNLGKPQVVFVCPSSNNSGREVYRDFAAARWDGGLTHVSSFGLITYRSPQGTNGRKWFSSKRLGDITRPQGEVAWMVEYINPYTAVFGYSDNFVHKGREPFWTGQFGNRHKGNNMLFVDGHVEFRDKRTGISPTDFCVRR